MSNICTNFITNLIVLDFLLWLGQLVKLAAAIFGFNDHLHSDLNVPERAKVCKNLSLIYLFYLS